MSPTGLATLRALPRSIFADAFTIASDLSRNKLGAMNSGLNRVYIEPTVLLYHRAAFI